MTRDVSDHRRRLQPDEATECIVSDSRRAWETLAPRQLRLPASSPLTEGTPMRGYVTKKGKQYYAVLYEGIDPATGKERRRWVKGGTKRGDAERLVTELVKRKNDGHAAPQDKVTVGKYLTEKWLPIQRTQLRPSTYDSYERNVVNHVVPVSAGSSSPSSRRKTSTRCTPRCSPRDDETASREDLSPRRSGRPTSSSTRR